MIPISTVRIDEEIEQEVLAVLRSGTIAQGPRVAEFETSFADLCGVKHAVAVNNGTTALVATLKMLDVPRGTTVLTSPFTFVATLNAALESGLRVRFADVDPFTFNVTAASLGDAATAEVSTVMPVHLYGQCAEMLSISELAENEGWAIVEDAAQAHGAQHSGHFAGSFGAGCFSFYATKNLTTGEGGMITTNDDHLADRLRIFRNQGMRQRYQYEMSGTNYRMTDLQAAIGIPQLKRIDQIIAARQRNAGLLTELLSDVEGVVTPGVLPENSHVWHQYTIRIVEGSVRTRDEVIDHLAESGIGCGIYYPRLTHDYDCFNGHPQIDLVPTPIASQMVKEVVSLPVHQYLLTSDLEKIADAVKTGVRG